MSNPAPVTHSVDGDGVGWIAFADPASRANLFNPATQAALRTAVSALAQVASSSSGPALRAVVVHSAKDKIFIAGADLAWLAALPDPAAAVQVARDGQELFGLVAAFPVPVVCAIHGACAGGGFELALACDWRLASDAKETVIGLPEVGLGLIPGWGGCTRLPRLVGPVAAVDHMLKAALVPAAAALRTGVVDELVPAAEWMARAKAAALRLAADGRPRRVAPPVAPAGFFSDQRRAAVARRRGQPAPGAMLDTVEQGAGLPLEAALELEAAQFGGVASGTVAKNLIHVFRLKEAARKTSLDAWFPGVAAATTPPKPFRTIGIVGAGVMGSGIAQWCATKGYGVILCDTSKPAIERGVAVIRALFAEAVKTGRLTHDAAHKMTGGIGITTSLEDFEICDLVIEAIVENVAEKQTVLAELSKVVDPGCVIASNTSALPIEELAAQARLPGRIVGLHFFNPVGRMPLVEVVLGPATTRETAERALAFTRTLGKTAVVCRSSPGFLVTRVLFFYLNEACRLREEGVPAAAIDGAMRDWGWPMGPLRLIDEVGVDVTDFIFGELQHYYPGRFNATALCRRMVAVGLLGRKNGAGAGFYAYAGEGEEPNPAAAALVPAAPPVFAVGALADRLNGVLIEETRRALAEGVVQTPDDADLALLLGAGFPAFRGGLLRFAGRGGAG